MEGTVGADSKYDEVNGRNFACLDGLSIRRAAWKNVCHSYLFSNTSVAVPQILMKSNKNVLVTVTA